MRGMEEKVGGKRHFAGKIRLDVGDEGSISLGGRGLKVRMMDVGTITAGTVYVR
jgi:hypothetical protein